MRTSTIQRIAILTLGAAVLAANPASAGGFKFGGGKSGGGKSGVSFNVGGGKSGGVKLSFGGGHKVHHLKHKKTCHRKVYHHVPVKKHYIYDHCYHPYYSYCLVHPGDTWYTISKRCYGHSHLWKHIATYNGLRLSSSALVPGMRVQLPVVNADGTLAASNAPAPAVFGAQAASLGQGAPFAPQGPQFGTQGQPSAPQGLPAGLNGAAPAPQGEAAPPANAAAPQPSAPSAPAATIRTIADEPKLPTVAIGSMLMLDGESLGDEKGSVRLRISGMTLPVEVIEWNASSAKIQLPTMELAAPMKAEIEVLRADGSLASKSAVELTPAASRLALTN